MKLVQLFTILFFAAEVFLGIFAGCSDNGNGDKPVNADGDSDSDGDTDADSDADSDSDSDPEPNGAIPSDAGEVCGNVTCEANLEAAKTAFVNGNYAAAYESYRCGNTVEAAAGAALTKLLTILESAEVTSLWSDFGVTPPVSPKDVIGPGGLLYQMGTYYNGTLDYTLTGSETANGVYAARIEQGGEPHVIFVSGDADTDTDADTDIVEMPEEYNFYSGKETREMNVTIEAHIQPTIPLAVGDVIELSYDCDSGGFEMPALIDNFRVDIWGDFNNDEIECYVSDTSSFSVCPTQPSAIEVLALGDFNQPVSFSFTDVPINCYSGGSSVETVFNGMFTGTLRDGKNDLNTDGMHMIFEDPEAVFENIPSTLTVNQLIGHLATLADDFEEAACYAAKASNNVDGPVYYFPSELTGHQAIPLFTRDTKMLAAAYYGAASIIYFVSSYDIPLQVGAITEMTNAQVVEEVNAHVGSLKSTNQLTQSRAMLQLAVNAALAALAAKESDGLFPSNTYTAAGEAVMLNYVNFVNESLQGLTNLPYTVPAIQVNLGTLFSTPMNPETVNADPLVLTNGDIEAVELFFQEMLGDVIPGFSYDMEEYDYGDESEQMEENAYEFEYAICRYLGLPC